MSVQVKELASELASALELAHSLGWGSAAQLARMKEVELVHSLGWESVTKLVPALELVLELESALESEPKLVLVSGSASGVVSV
mmetsp:Transcript_38253/g.77245  ORF Transcript_38253/g.77245 Transcript_38253/m.77245 type:complete len:84 (-) Transcript_38253:382-633(-)